VTIRRNACTLRLLTLGAHLIEAFPAREPVSAQFAFGERHIMIGDRQVTRTHFFALRLRRELEIFRGASFELANPDENL
jgi:hypothetical protein